MLREHIRLHEQTESVSHLALVSQSLAITVTKMKALEKTNENLEREVNILKDELVKREEMISAVSTNEVGTEYLWRIKCVGKIMSSAKEKNLKGVVASELFPGPRNYSFNLQAELHGGSEGEFGKSFSLFLYNSPNDYDSILNWPVNVECDLVMLHPQHRHLDSRKRIEHPYLKGGNRGFASFMSLNRLPDFICDDSLYIKCTVKIL